MLISALNIILIPIMEAGLTARGLTATVKRTNQPRQQGTPSAATVFFFHAGTTPYGFVRRKDWWDATTSTMYHKEEQYQWTRYQINALAPQSPGAPTAATAADYVKAAAQTMQSDAARAALLAQKVGVLRISDVISTYFQDERGQNEESPSFDLILGHKDELITSGDFITNYTFAIDSV